MFTNPTLGRQFVHQREREMLAHASQLRLARGARQASLVTRRAERARGWKGRLSRRTRPAASPCGGALTHAPARTERSHSHAQ